MEPGIAHRLAGGAKTELRVAIVAPRILRIHVQGGVPVAHLGADLAGIVGGIELRDAVDATAAGDETGPEGIDRMAERSDGAEQGFAPIPGEPQARPDVTESASQPRTSRR